MASQHPSSWNTGLCACCADASTCCYAFWCCPCFTCTTSGEFGENCCLPLCDMMAPAVASACGIPLCVPPAALSMRVAVRNKYGIKGSLCNDIITSCFCVWCSWCQVAREIKHQKKHRTTVVNAQPTPMVVVQNQVFNQAAPSMAAPYMAAPSGYVAH